MKKLSAIVAAYLATGYAICKAGNAYDSVHKAADNYFEQNKDIEKYRPIVENATNVLLTAIVPVPYACKRVSHLVEDFKKTSKDVTEDVNL